ncbi:MAG TPA: hypothetical protein VMA36_20570 [Candidatus Limnocylindria bacterium]|nr:hypothetical protein [Candidatus Limnocylindria bacterium]
MELLIALAVLTTLAALALAAPFAGADSRCDEATWPGAPLSGRELRRRLEEASAARSTLSRC